MEIIDYSKDNILILTIKGRIDALTAQEFKEILFGFIEKGRSSIVLDMHNLEYISSAGIRVLYQALNIIENKQGKVVISAPSENVKKVFDIVELFSDFPMHKDIDEAVKVFS
jgi:anti-sigma B factor antagonist